MRQLLSLTLTLVCLMPAWSLAETSLWSVSKGDHKIYIGGTIHLLKPSDFPYPEDFDKAYAVVDQLVFETDIAAASSPAFAIQMMTMSMPEDRLTLKDRLSPSVFDALSSYVSEQGLSMAQINPLTPAFATLTLITMKYQSLGYREGVDQYYFNKANSDGKQTLFFETLEQQLEFIDAINQVDADQLVQSTLADLGSLDEMGRDMTRAWREGRADKLFDLAGDMKTDYPQMYEVMLTERNRRWVPDIEAIFNSTKPTLILVGALHLAGPDSVLAMLEQRGYVIEYARFK